jgi:hypothetical protein
MLDFTRILEEGRGGERGERGREGGGGAEVWFGWGGGVGPA